MHVLMSRFSSLLIVAVAALTATSCGIGEKTKRASRDVTDKWELSGAYANRCHAPTLVAEILKDNFAKETYDFNLTGSFTQVYEQHEDAACSQLRLTRTLSGTYEIVGDADAEKLPETKLVNLTIDKATLTPGSDASASDLNEAEYCGITDWKSGAERDVTDKDCGGLTIRKGEVVFDIYKVKDDTLYMGKTSLLSRGTSGANRPEELDTDLFYTRR